MKNWDSLIRRERKFLGTFPFKEIAFLFVMPLNFFFFNSPFVPTNSLPTTNQCHT